MWTGRDPPGEPPGPQGDAGPLLDPVTTGQDAAGRGADERLGIEQGLHRGGHVLERAHVVAGHEEDGDVGPVAAEHLADRPDHVADGGGRHPVLGERGGVGHVRPGGGG